MEKAEGMETPIARNGGKLTLRGEKEKIKRFRGILGKASEETILWAIREAEEL